ncbi:hypothetical protein D3C72_1784050 [compost metagenome]
MVEEDARGGEHVVGFAVVHRDPVAVELGDAVGAAGVEGRRFDLGHGLDLAEHLRGAGLVEARLGGHLAHRVEHAGDAQAGELAGQHGLGPGGGDEALGREVVHLVRARGLDRVDQGLVVEEVAREELELALEVRDALVGDGAGAAGQAVDFVALLEQQLREVAAVLSRDARDQCAFGQRPELLNS